MTAGLSCEINLSPETQNVKKKTQDDLKLKAVSRPIKKLKETRKVTDLGDFEEQ